MAKTDMDIRKLRGEMACKVFGAIYRTMLSSGTAETDHQAVEATPHIGLHMRIDYSIHMFEEPEYFSIILKKTDNRLITPCKLPVRLISSGIMD
jgi:hypothetical protein